MLGNRTFVGIDIGGTNTKIALINDQGEISHLQRLKMADIEPTLDSYIQHVSVLINKLFQHANAVEGIGICSPGMQMDDSSGVLYSVNMPILEQFDLRGYFSNIFHVPVTTCNDLISHGLAEYQFGSGKGISRFLSVSLGTGIGHAFIVDGKPVITLKGISGDSGRMILDVRSQICDSSQIYGSAEALCGVHAIELLAKEKLGANCCLTAYDIIKAAREDDQAAVAIMSVIAQRVAHLLMNLSSIYFPHLISITGGQTEAGESFLIKCDEEFRRISQNFFKKYFTVTGLQGDIQIVKSEAGGLAGLIGSVVPLIQNF